MIQGHDFVFSVTSGVIAAEVCADVVRDIWPDAVCEDARRNGGLVALSDAHIGDAQELFIYRDHETAQRSEESGIDDEVGRGYLHLLVDPRRLTIVLHDPSKWPFSEVLGTMRAYQQSGQHFLRMTTVAG